jgi:hypothetical protein
MLTSTSFSDLVGSISFDGSFFSTPRTIPSLVLIPMVVEPNFNQLFIFAISYLDCFNCVLNLIDSALWRKSVDTTIVVLLAIELWSDSLIDKGRLTCPSTSLFEIILKLWLIPQLKE